MLTITNEEIFNILKKNVAISFPKPFNLAIDNDKGVSAISVSGIIIDPNDSMAYTFIGKCDPTWGRYYNKFVINEILEHTIDDVYPNKEDAQEMIQYLKSLL